MKTKHTKGKWEIDKRASLRICVNDKTIANCGGSIANEFLEEAQSNAKLIASSPLLLEALIECLEGVRELNGEYQDGWDETIKKAEIAIKKATE